MNSDAASTEVTLQQLAQRGAYLVEALPHQPGGVDFLGLREVNLNLMQQLLPTVNNVVSHVRIYTVLAWAWWRAADLARQQGADVLPERILRFVERVEILFTWSHTLSGKGAGLPGNTAKPPRSSGAVLLDLKSWKRPPLTSALMAPVQYGPSLRFPSGFRYVAPSAGASGLLVPVETVLPAIHSLDSRLGASSQAQLFTTLKDVRATAEQARELFPIWRLDKCEGIEAKVFREHFGDPKWHDRGVLEGDTRWRRSRTIAYLLDILKQTGKAITIGELRVAAASQFLPTGRRWVAKQELWPAAVAFTLLQARQGQRQALEALFSWVERVLKSGSGHTPDSLAEHAVQIIHSADGAFRGARSLKQVAGWLRKKAGAFGSMPYALCRNEALDPFQLMSTTALAARDPGQSSALLSTSIQLLLLSGLLASAMREEKTAMPLLELAPTRIPLKTVIALLDDDRPLRESFRQILGEMVIGQHLAVAVARNVDETQRLRISLEEEGLVSLARRPLQPAPTPDRLGNLLPLMSEAGLCKARQDGGITRYSLLSATPAY